MSRGDPLQIAGLRVQSAQSAIRRGSEDWGQVPEFIRSLLEHGDWRHFIDGFGKERKHKSFEEFVTADVPDGLGTTVDVLLDVIGHRDADVERMVRDALKHQGRRSNFPDNNREVYGDQRPYALRRLYRQRRDLYDRVAAGEQSPHSAMVEAGFRKATITVPIETDALAAALRRRLDHHQLDLLVKALERDTP